MKGSISKDHKFCLIVKKEDLKSLNDFICKEYKHIEYTIHTNNGIKYELISFDEIINYDNYDFKKIIQIYIQAQNEKSTDNIFFPDFAISISDITNYSTSISYYIKNATEKEIDYHTQKIEELIHEFKPKYSWLYNRTNGLLVSLMTLLLIVIPLQILLKDKIDKALYYTFIIFGGIFTGWGWALSYDRVVSIFFQKTIFCIGKQQEFYDNKKSLRKNLLGGLLLHFLLAYWLLF